MKKILSILTIFATAAIAIAPVSSINSVNSAMANSQAQIANSQSQAALIPQDANLTISATEPTQMVFGENLFNGNFTMVSQHIYNPDYILAIGDIVNVKLWGAYEFEQQLTID